MKNLFLSAAFLFTGIVSAFAFENPDAVVGVWQNGTGKARVQIYKYNGKYYGKVVWLKTAVYENGLPKLDIKNPDPNLRSRPVIGLQMLRDAVYEDGEWTGGRLYNPDDGKEYKCILKVKDSNTLKVRGYIGFSWIGKTDTWQRVK